MINDATTVRVLNDKQAKRYYAMYDSPRGSFMLTGTYIAEDAMWCAEQFRCESGIEAPVEYYETVMKNGNTVTARVR